MYNTPELLLIGAAQHLVLGDSELNTGSTLCNPSDEKTIEAGETYLDFPAW